MQPQSWLREPKFLKEKTMSRKSLFVLSVVMLTLALFSVSFAGYGTISCSNSPTIQNTGVQGIIPIIPPVPGGK
jgi:hypothetical protein